MVGLASRKQLPPKVKHGGACTVAVGVTVSDLPALRRLMETDAKWDRTVDTNLNELMSHSLVGVWNTRHHGSN